MYAIIETGGKQYKVSPGDTVDIEKIEIPEDDDEVRLDNVLMIVDDDAVEVGKPVIEDAAVVAHLVDQVKGEKIVIFKSKKRKGYRRKTGHRQKYTRLHIDEIRRQADDDEEVKAEVNAEAETPVVEEIEEKGE
ncbi:50S ribosomal protein L21 [Candidatus Poribacteria bacterium]|nr:50S ribosomal protein L21 [Candidatus Poribacteria bacterium]